jgi:hypothetical protein
MRVNASAVASALPIALDDRRGAIRPGEASPAARERERIERLERYVQHVVQDLDGIWRQRRRGIAARTLEQFVAPTRVENGVRRGSEHLGYGAVLAQ